MLNNELSSIGEICEKLGVSRSWIEDYLNGCTSKNFYIGDFKIIKMYDTAEINRYIANNIKVYQRQCRYDFVADLPKHQKELAIQKYDDYINVLDSHPTIGQIERALDAFNSCLSDKTLELVSSPYTKRHRAPEVEIPIPDELKQKIMSGKFKFYSIKKLVDEHPRYNTNEMLYREIYDACWLSIKLHGKTYFCEDYTFDYNLLDVPNTLYLPMPRYKLTEK